MISAIRWNVGQFKIIVMWMIYSIHPGFSRYATGKSQFKRDGPGVREYTFGHWDKDGSKLKDLDFWTVGQQGRVKCRESFGPENFPFL
jgi:hypothetical protein